MKARRTVASDHKIGCVAKAHRRKGQPGGELHRVEIEPTTRCRRGQLYRVCHAGRILIESSLVPGHDACRALLALGLGVPSRSGGQARRLRTCASISWGEPSGPWRRVTGSVSAQFAIVRRPRTCARMWFFPSPSAPGRARRQFPGNPQAEANCPPEKRKVQVQPIFGAQTFQAHRRACSAALGGIRPASRQGMRGRERYRQADLPQERRTGRAARASEPASEPANERASERRARTRAAHSPGQ